MSNKYFYHYKFYIYFNIIYMIDYPNHNNILLYMKDIHIAINSTDKVINIQYNHFRHRFNNTLLNICINFLVLVYIFHLHKMYTYFCLNNQCKENKLYKRIVKTTKFFKFKLYFT